MLFKVVVSSSHRKTKHGEEDKLTIDDMNILKSIGFRFVIASVYFSNPTEIHKQYGCTKAEYEGMSNEEKVEVAFNIVGKEYDSYIIINSHTYFKHKHLLEVIDAYDNTNNVQTPLDFDYEKLSEKLLGFVGNNTNLFNNRLEVHQPNTPLLTYNKVRVENGCCTDHLQDLLNSGWRIVAVTPQPDQRRPDYILGIYEREV